MTDITNADTGFYKRIAAGIKAGRRLPDDRGFKMLTFLRRLKDAGQMLDVDPEIDMWTRECSDGIRLGFVGGVSGWDVGMFLTGLGEEMVELNRGRSGWQRVIYPLTPLERFVGLLVKKSQAASRFVGHL